MADDYSPVSRFTSTGLSTTIHRSYSNKDYSHTATDQIKTGSFSPYQPYNRPSKTLATLDSCLIFDKKGQSYSTSTPHPIETRTKFSKASPENPVAKLLREASQVGPSRQDRVAIRQLSFDLSMVAPAPLCQHCSLPALLAALGLPDIKSVMSTVKSAQQLASLISNHIRQSATHQSTINQSVVNKSTVGQSGMQQSTAGLMAEVVRLKHLIHRMQNESRPLGDTDDRMAAMKVENDDLKRKVADLIAVLKCKEDEGGVSLLLVGDCTPGVRRTKAKESISKVELSAIDDKKRDITDWKVIVEEQRMTIENLNKLLENLRYENTELKKKLTDSLKTQEYFRAGESRETNRLGAEELRRKIKGLRSGGRCLSTAGLYN